MGNSSSNAARDRTSSSNMKRDDFMAAIKETNRFFYNRKDENGQYTCFALTKDGANGILWKNQIRVKCLKVDEKSRRYIGYKELNYDQFLNIYNLTQTLDSSDSDMNTSRLIFDDPSVCEGKCCICMENENQVLLPCLHSFCLVCVSNEMEFRPQFTCPLCRTRIDRPIENSWEVPDRPGPEEVTDYLNRLTS